MSDLVDYLRDKLAHADDPVCTCPRIEVTMHGDPEPVFVKGWDRRCPTHGPAGPAPEDYAVRSNVVPDLDWIPEVRDGKRTGFGWLRVGRRR